MTKARIKKLVERISNHLQIDVYGQQDCIDSRTMKTELDDLESLVEILINGK